MPKLKTPLVKFEEYKAPWEVDSDGNEIPEDKQEIDPGKLKKYLHGLLSDKDRLQTTVTTVTGERDELQTKFDAKTREGESDDEAKQREHQKAIDAAKAEGSLPALKLEVALDIEGITPKQAKALAKRLTGTSREELEEDAEAIVEEFGLVKDESSQSTEGDEGKDGDEGNEPATPARRPRRPRAGGDPAPSTPSLPDPSDTAKLNELFPR